jgi:hypothetical protein
VRDALKFEERKFHKSLKYFTYVNGSHKFKDLTRKQNGIQYSVSAILHVGISVTVGEFYFKNIYLIKYLMGLFVENSLKSASLQKLNYTCFFKRLFTWLTSFFINLVVCFDEYSLPL